MYTVGDTGVIMMYIQSCIHIHNISANVAYTLYFTTERILVVLSCMKIVS